MPKIDKDKRINDIVTSLERVKRIRQDEYLERINLYNDMRNGGEGGQFRSSGVAIRDLHFSGWKDSDFQTILELLGETDRLTDEERAVQFSHENKSIWKKIGKIFASDNPDPNLDQE